MLFSELKEDFSFKLRNSNHAPSPNRRWESCSALCFCFALNVFDYLWASIIINIPMSSMIHGSYHCHWHWGAVQIESRHLCVAGTHACHVAAASTDGQKNTWKVRSMYLAVFSTQVMQMMMMMMTRQKQAGMQGCCASLRKNRLYKIPSYVNQVN